MLVKVQWYCIALHCIAKEIEEMNKAMGFGIGVLIVKDKRILYGAFETHWKKIQKITKHSFAAKWVSHVAEHFSCYPLHTTVKIIFRAEVSRFGNCASAKENEMKLWLCQTSNRNILSWFGLMLLIFAFSRLITWAYVYITSSYSRYFGVKKERKEKKREKEERKRIVEARLLNVVRTSVHTPMALHVAQL